MKRMNRLISFVIAILVFTTSMYSNTFVKSDANTNLHADQELMQRQREA